MIFPPANCGDPIDPINGYIEPYQNTTEGAEIFFRCDMGFVPAGRMGAVCEADGRWNPDPSTILCTCTSTHNIERESLIDAFFYCIQRQDSIASLIPRLLLSFWSLFIQPKTWRGVLEQTYYVTEKLERLEKRL